MKTGDLIRLPQDLGYALALEVVTHNQDPSMPTGDTAVLVIQEWGPDWWDVDVCMVMNEGR